MPASVFASPPDLIERQDVPVMGRTTADDLTRIQDVWPSFESLVGLRGRRMYALVDSARGTMPGGRFHRGRIVGEPPEVYGAIAPGMAELEAAMRWDETRPLVEFYRRRDTIELWVPVQVAPR